MTYRRHSPADESLGFFLFLLLLFSSSLREGALEKIRKGEEKKKKKKPSENTGHCQNVKPLSTWRVIGVSEGGRNCALKSLNEEKIQRGQIARPVRSLLMRTHEV